MATRYRSRDGRSETKEILEGEDLVAGPAGAVSDVSGGDTARALSTREQAAAVDASDLPRVGKRDDPEMKSPRGGAGPLQPETDERLTAPLPHGTWVLVADGRKALLLENHGDGEMLDLKVRRAETQEHPQDHDGAADLPLPQQDTGKPDHSPIPLDLWHEIEETRFAEEMAKVLYDHAHAERFRHLVIAAAPGTLGDLRNAAHKSVRERVIAEVPKDLTNLPVDRIERTLVDALYVAQPNPDARLRGSGSASRA